MRTPVSVTCKLPTETATADWAERLAPRLRAGDTILLSGPIGAGKTHFARALIQARLRASGREEDVPSPTFTLVQTYCDGATEVWHADLYRVVNADELIELGLDEAFRSAIVLVEWPDRLGSEAPASALHLSFAEGDRDGARDMAVFWDDPKWRERLAGILCADAPDD